jgi:Predicted Zn-dependent protease (DUF2268)
MKATLILMLALSMLTTGVLGQGSQSSTGNGARKLNTDPEAVQFVTSDISLFWQAYDMAKPENDINVFRDQYLRKGSVGLKEFAQRKNVTSCLLADQIETHPKYYASLRTSSLKVDSYKASMRASFRKLKELYPDAVFPDVYFLIGKMTSAGTETDAGLLIGVDRFGRSKDMPLEELDAWQRATLHAIEDIPVVVAHELIHYQQKHLDLRHDLLKQSIIEGGADFIGELISGRNANEPQHAYGDPREKELWTEFKKEMNGTDVSYWLFQGDEAKDRPADLGYYIGYKICESYYRNVPNKTRAVKDIIEVKDFEQFLKLSGYEEKVKGN